MKNLRNGVGATLFVVYIFAGGLTTEAYWTCDETVTCQNGIPYHQTDCEWDNIYMSCEDVYNSVCAHEPYFGWVTQFSCTMLFPVDPEDWWYCQFYPGYCRSSGSAQCQAAGSYYCEG